MSKKKSVAETDAIKQINESYARFQEGGRLRTQAARKLRKLLAAQKKAVK